MSNLLTRKIMDNLSRQYKKEKDVDSTLIHGESYGKRLSDQENKMLTSIINRDETLYGENRGLQKIQKLSDFIGNKGSYEEKLISFRKSISLEDLARKQK